MKLPGNLIVLLLIVLSACTNESNSSDDSSAENCTVAAVFDSPGGKITGLAWGGGSLWAVDAYTSIIFRIDTGSGDIIDSFPCNPPSSFVTTGLAYSEKYDVVFLKHYKNATPVAAYQYSADGEFLGSTRMCGG